VRSFYSLRFPIIVARQRLGKHVPAAMNTHATLEKLLDPLAVPYPTVHCVPITRKLRNAAGRISVYSVMTLVGPDSCSESFTVEIKKVRVGVIFLRAQFSSFFFFITSNVHY
jgi:hypothetical protein